MGMLRTLLVFVAVAAAGPGQLPPAPRRPGYVQEQGKKDREPRPRRQSNGQTSAWWVAVARAWGVECRGRAAFQRGFGNTLADRRLAKMGSRGSTRSGLCDSPAVRPRAYAAVMLAAMLASAALLGAIVGLTAAALQGSAVARERETTMWPAARSPQSLPPWPPAALVTQALCTRGPLAQALCTMAALLGVRVGEASHPGPGSPTAPRTPDRPAEAPAPNSRSGRRRRRRQRRAHGVLSPARQLSSHLADLELHTPDPMVQDEGVPIGELRRAAMRSPVMEPQGPSEHDLFGDLTEQNAWEKNENAETSVPRHGAAADGAPTSDEELLPGTPREPGAHRRRLDMDGAAAPGAPAAADPGPAAASPRRRNANGHA